MKLKVKEIYQLNQEVIGLSKAKLNVGTRFALNNLKAKIVEVLNQSEKEKFELFKEFGEQKEDNLVVPKEKEKEFYEKLNVILQEEIEQDFVFDFERISNVETEQDLEIIFRLQK